MIKYTRGDNMIKKIIKFKNSKEWIEFERYYNNTDFMQQMDFFRYEDANTNFLASILEEKNVYGLGSYPMKLFIELIACKDNWFFNDFNLLENYSISDIKVSKQKIINSGRLDLFVEFKLNDMQCALIIEAKLFSLEHNKQCQKYKKELDASLGKSHKLIYVYLSLDDKEKISSDDYIHITYQDLIDMVYTPCSFKAQNKDMILTIDEYVKSFARLYERNDIDINLVPITYTGKELTTNLWQKHNSALQSLLNTPVFLEPFYNSNKALFTIFLTTTLKLAEQLELDENLKISILSILNQTKHQNVFESSMLGNSDFLYTVFKDIIAKKNIKNIKDIPKEILITTETWLNIISDSEIENDPRKDYYRLSKDNKEPITIGKEQYWYCDWNNGADMNRFVKAVKKHYPEYESKIYRLDEVTFKENF